jgi:hypothetical protein
MFEREIQRAKELLSQRLTGAERFVYWREIRERADIPIFYRNFFGAESQWWVFEEQLQRAANPRFDYTHEMLAQHTVEADRYRMEAARFDRQDLAATIELAVKTRFNYILRPRTTLKWFVYRGEPTKTLNEVLLRMDYFLEYDYLLDGFRKWISAKQQEQTNPQTLLVSVVEFDRTIQAVDNEVILEYSPEEFTDLLTPIYEMFDEIHAADRSLQQYRGKAPMPAIIIFLDDKGIYRIAQELEEMMKKPALRYVGQREFLHLLNDIINKLEHETPINVADHQDPVTLPLGFDDEPIIKADDTIGELAIGAAIRKPKFPNPAPAADKPNNKATTSKQDEAPLPLDSALEQTLEQAGDDATDELPEGFGMELASLAEALRAADQELQEDAQFSDNKRALTSERPQRPENPPAYPTQSIIYQNNTVQENIVQKNIVQENIVQEDTSPSNAAQSLEIADDTRDADYPFIHPAESAATGAQICAAENTMESTAENTVENTTKQEERQERSSPQTPSTETSSKSTLFSRWSSIFVPKNEQ